MATKRRSDLTQVRTATEITGEGGEDAAAEIAGGGARMRMRTGRQTRRRGGRDRGRAWAGAGGGAVVDAFDIDARG
jgi:hypothetical protein